MLTLSAFSQTSTNRCDTCETALPDYILRKAMADIEKGKATQVQTGALIANAVVLRKKVAERDSIIRVLQTSDTAYVSIISSNTMSTSFLKKQLADCNNQALKLKKAAKKQKKNKDLFKMLTALITVVSTFLIVKK